MLAYGNARQLVLGLEVVLADGRIWNGLKGLKKDNTGYDLKDLFIGSEGTLGIITAAVLKLFPKPAEKATAFVALPDLASALSAVQPGAGDGRPRPHRLRVHGRHRARPGAEAHVRARAIPSPTRHPWYVLIEISGLKADGAAERVLTEVLASAERARPVRRCRGCRLAGAGAATSGACAKSDSPAQKPEGGNIKNDVSVPVAAHSRVHRPRRRRGCAPVPGRAAACRSRHFGDGSVHYNIAQPTGMTKAAFLAQWDDITRAVHDIVHRPRRLDLGRARHRPDEARRPRARQERRRARPDAPHQGVARPQGHPQSGQGALAPAAA